MSVRRGCLQLLVGDVHENAHQIIARLLRGDGEARLVDNLAERRCRKLEPRWEIALGNHREIVARERREVEACPTGGQLHLALGGIELDLAAVRKLADDVE